MTSETRLQVSNFIFSPLVETMIGISLAASLSPTASYFLGWQDFVKAKDIRCLSEADVVARKALINVINTLHLDADDVAETLCQTFLPNNGSLKLFMDRSQGRLDALLDISDKTFAITCIQHCLCELTKKE